MLNKSRGWGKYGDNRVRKQILYKSSGRQRGRYGDNGGELRQKLYKSTGKSREVWRQ